MAEINERIDKLEKTFARLTGGAFVGAFLILGFFGFANFYQIPNAVRDALPTAVKNSINTERPRFMEELKEFKKKAEKESAAMRKNAKVAQETADELLTLLDEVRARSVELRIESGEVAIHHKKFPDLRHTNSCKKGEEGQRGAKNQWIPFAKPFQKTPKVMVALKYLDHVDENKNDSNLRINAFVSKVKKKGFNYNLLTWCRTDIWGAGLSWIAYGY